MYKLPTTLTRNNFEAVLIKFYTHILQFLTRAIQIYRTPSIKRAFVTMFKEISNIENFKRDYNKLKTKVEIEISNYDRILNTQNRENTI